MAVNFPASLDSFTNPASNSSVANPSHAQQHADANDAIEALEAKVGVTGSTVTTSHDYKISQLESLVTSSVAGAKSIYQDVRNSTGSSIAKATPVYISGTEGASGRLFISPSTNATEVGSSKTLGLTSSTIANNNNGQIISEGVLTNIDTTGAVDGDPVWLGSNGTKIYGLANKPVAPAHLVFLGVVINGGHATSGSMFVKVQNGFELNELHDVLISNVQNNQVLRYDSTTGLWKNQTIDNLFDSVGSASAAQSAAITSSNLYTDTAITSLSNSISNPNTGYVPVGDVGVADGVASLGPDGFVPAAQLNLDEKIQDTTALMFTSATHSNITVAYDDNTGRLSLTGIPLTQEQVQDFIAPLFAHAFHTNLTATYDDTNNRVLLESSGGGGGSGTGGSLTNSWWLAG